MKILIAIAICSVSAWGQWVPIPIATNMTGNTVPGGNPVVTTSALNCTSSSARGRAASFAVVVVSDYLKNVTGTVTDSVGNTYTQRTHADLNGGNSAVAIYEALTFTPGSAMTFTYTTSGSGHFPTVAPVCYALPTGTTASVDQVATPNGDGCLAPCTVGTFTPTQIGDIVIVAGSADEVSQAAPGYGVYGAKTGCFDTYARQTVQSNLSEAIIAASCIQSAPTTMTPQIVGYVSGTSAGVSYKITPITAPSTSITWVQQTVATTNWPAFVGWTNWYHDPVSMQDLIRVGPQGVSTPKGIFSTDDYTFNSNTSCVAGQTCFTHIGGSSLGQAYCDGDWPTAPGMTHPGYQQWVDTKRYQYYTWGGPDDICNPYSSTAGVNTSGTAVHLLSTTADFTPSGGITTIVGKTITINGAGPYTIASVSGPKDLTLSTSAGTNTNATFQFVDANQQNPRQKSIHYMNLNGNPTSNVWAGYTPSQNMTSNNASACAYDPDDDITFCIGFDGGAYGHDNWVTCRTDKNPTPGTPTPLQQAAGCAVGEDWNEVPIPTGTGWVYNTNNPGFPYFTSITYAPPAHKFILYGGSTPAPVYSNDTWTLDPTKLGSASTSGSAWTKVCSGCVTGTTKPYAASSNAGQPPVAWDGNHNLLIFHQYQGTGSPQDWAYNYSTDTWSVLASTGPSSASESYLAFDPETNRMVLWSQNSGSGNPDIFVAQMGGSVPVNVTSTVISEAIYAGGPTTGIARTNEPVCQGFPLADTAGVTDPQTLSWASGASAGQFRTLGSRTDTTLKWAEVCAIVPSVTAGGTVNLTLQSNSTGNFGGGNLASLSGSTITINNTGGATACGSAGATCWTINAGAGYNVFDTVRVGTTTMVATGTSDGLVVTGPSTTGTYPDNVTCGSLSGQSPCTKDYKSKNDSGATCAIENNGPVYASVRCIGNLDDGSSHVYMQYTTRSYFYKGKNYAKVQAIYRNANYDTGSTPSTDCNNSAGSCQGQTKNTAYKGYKSRELRLKFANPTSASSLSYTFGTHTGTPATGTLNQSGGTDSAYIYQGLSDSLIPPDNSCAFIPMTTWSAGHAFTTNQGVLDSNGNTQFVTSGGTSGGSTPTWNTTYLGTTTDGSVTWTRQNYCSTTYSPDNGYTIAKNASATNTGTYQQYPKGWGVISDGSGNSIQIGINQFAGYWAKSLEFNGGGTDVRVGLSASENGNPAGGPGNGTFAQYAPWPGWQIDDVFIEFNTSAPSSFDDEFQKFQAPLVLRPSTTSYINSTAVYPYPLPAPTDEDALYVAASNNVTTTGGFPIAATNFCYGTTANCYPDLGVTSPLITANRQLGVYHAFVFAGGGPATQEDFRWVWALNFLKRGYTGSYLAAANFAKMLTEKGVFHADGTSSTSRTVNGFHWSSRPDASASPPEQDGFGYPIISGGTGNYCCSTRATIGNFQNSFMNIPDNLHDHTYHQEDFYMLTGDETIKEALVPKTDYFTNANTYQGKSYATTGGGVWPVRASAIQMVGASLMSEYLTSIGDSTNATAALAQAKLMYDTQVDNDLCVVDGAGNVWPTGCQAAPVASLGNGMNLWPGAGSAIPFNTGIVDSNGNVQVATTGGTTGSGPTWATSLNATTTDGSVTWTLKRIGNTLPFGYDLPGVSKVRGAAWTPTSRGGVWCAGQGFYRGNDLFQYSIYIEGILALRHAQPPSWTKVDYQKALDTTYGVSQFILSETFRIGGASTSWYGLPQSGASAAYNGAMVGVMYDMPQYCNSTGGNGGTPGVSYGHGPLVQFGGTGPIFDPYSTISSSQGFWMAFWPQYLVNGGLTSDQWQKMYYAMAWPANQGFHFFEDVGTYQFGALAYASANATRQLQDLSFSCLNCSGGTVNYQLQFTPPAGACTADGCLRIKWSPKIIANSGGYSSISPTAGDGLLGYETMDTRTWTLNPATNATFFGANVIAEPTPTPGSSMTVTVNTATTGLLASNFSVKALNFGACTLTPSTLGPWTNTQASGFGSLVASGCTSSTYACTGLPTGLSINSSTGAITGTISAASTFTPSCTYDTATQPYTILVNAAPTVTTSGAMAAGTQGSAYSQSISTSGGTSPLTCALFGGSLTGSGLTVNSNCTVTGTAGTPATYTFTVKATDSNSIVSAASSNITITINASGGGGAGGTVFGGSIRLGGTVKR